MPDPLPIRITAHDGIDVEITDETEEVREDGTVIRTVWYEEFRAEVADDE